MNSVMFSKMNVMFYRDRLVILQAYLIENGLYRERSLSLVLMAPTENILETLLNCTPEFLLGEVPLWVDSNCCWLWS
jgi:hypothetical protein